MPFLVYLYGRACEIFFFTLDLGVLLNVDFVFHLQYKVHYDFPVISYPEQPPLHVNKQNLLLEYSMEKFFHLLS